MNVVRRENVDDHRIVRQAGGGAATTLVHHDNNATGGEEPGNDADPALLLPNNRPSRERIHTDGSAASFASYLLVPHDERTTTPPGERRKRIDPDEPSHQRDLDCYDRQSRWRQLEQEQQGGGGKELHDYSNYYHYRNSNDCDSSFREPSSPSPSESNHHHFAEESVEQLQNRIEELEAELYDAKYEASVANDSLRDLLEGVRILTRQMKRSHSDFQSVEEEEVVVLAEKDGTMMDISVGTTGEDNVSFKEETEQDQREKEYQDGSSDKRRIFAEGSRNNDAHSDYSSRLLPREETIDEQNNDKAHNNNHIISTDTEIRLLEQLRSDNRHRTWSGTNIGPGHNNSSNRLRTWSGLSTGSIRSYVSDDDRRLSDIFSGLDGSAGADLLALSHACRMVSENARFASTEAANLVEDARTAQATARTASEKAARSERAVKKLYKENKTLKREIDKMQRERKLLIREVRTLLRQKDIWERMKGEAEREEILRGLEAHVIDALEVHERQLLVRAESAGSTTSQVSSEKDEEHALVGGVRDDDDGERVVEREAKDEANKEEESSEPRGRVDRETDKLQREKDENSGNMEKLTQVTEVSEHQTSCADAKSASMDNHSRDLKTSGDNNDTDTANIQSTAPVEKDNSVIPEPPSVSPVAPDNIIKEEKRKPGTFGFGGSGGISFGSFSLQKDKEKDSASDPPSAPRGTKPDDTAREEKRKSGGFGFGGAGGIGFGAFATKEKTEDKATSSIESSTIEKQNHGTTKTSSISDDIKSDDSNVKLVDKRTPGSLGFGASGSIGFGAFSAHFCKPSFMNRMTNKKEADDAMTSQQKSKEATLSKLTDEIHVEEKKSDEKSKDDTRNIDVAAVPQTLPESTARDEEKYTPLHFSMGSTSVDGARTSGGQSQTHPDHPPPASVSKEEEDLGSKVKSFFQLPSSSAKKMQSLLNIDDDGIDDSNDTCDPTVKPVEGSQAAHPVLDGKENKSEKNVVLSPKRAQKVPSPPRLDSRETCYTNSPLGCNGVRRRQFGFDPRKVTEWDHLHAPNPSPRRASLGSMEYMESHFIRSLAVPKTLPPKAKRATSLLATPTFSLQLSAQKKNETGFDEKKDELPPHLPPSVSHNGSKVIGLPRSTIRYTRRDGVPVLENNGETRSSSCPPHLRRKS